MNIHYDLFFNWQTEKKKNLFWINKMFLLPFSTAQTEKNPRKKLVKKSDELEL